MGIQCLAQLVKQRIEFFLAGHAVGGVAQGTVMG